MKDNRIQPYNCPACGYRMDRALDPKGDASPDPGAIMVCIMCAAFLIYEGPGKVRKGDADDAYTFGVATMSEVERVQAAVRQARR